MYNVNTIINQHLNTHPELQKDGMIICHNRTYLNDPNSIKDTCNLLEALLTTLELLFNKFPDPYIERKFQNKKNHKTTKMIDQMVNIINSNPSNLNMSATAYKLYSWISTWTLLNTHKFHTSQYNTLSEFYLYQIIPVFFPDLDLPTSKLLNEILYRTDHRLKQCIKHFKHNAPVPLIEHTLWNIFNDLHFLLNLPTDIQ